MFRKIWLQPHELPLVSFSEIDIIVLSPRLMRTENITLVYTFCIYEVVSQNGLNFKITLDIHCSRHVCSMFCEPAHLCTVASYPYLCHSWRFDVRSCSIMEISEILEKCKRGFRIRLTPFLGVLLVSVWSVRIVALSAPDNDLPTYFHPHD